MEVLIAILLADALPVGVAMYILHLGGHWAAALSIGVLISIFVRHCFSGDDT